jgi:hypothetical protein
MADRGIAPVTKHRIRAWPRRDEPARASRTRVCTWSISDGCEGDNGLLNRVQFSTILAVSIAIWAAVLLVTGKSLSLDYLAPYGITVGIMTAALVTFDRWVWHWPIFRGWLVATPYIDGVWDVTLISTYVDPVTEERVPPVIGTLTIAQTYSTLLVNLATARQASHTIGYSIHPIGAGNYEVIGTYQSDPSIAYREGSPIHYGTFKLRLQNSVKPSLIGHYWTDRKTNGDLVARNRKKRSPQKGS